MLDTKTNADLASTPVTISAFNYGVNNLGQRTGVSTSGSAFAGGYSLGWAYNASGELEEEDFGANQTSEARDRAFLYDAIGNREKTANGLLAGLPATPNYAANGLNQYTVANGITLPTTPAPHDADGNAKAWNIRDPLATGSSSLAACTFTWDAENRLTEVRNSGGTVIATYAYDFQSRRIRKTVAGGEDVAFFYDGWNCVAEYQIGTSVPLARYTWGQDLSGSMQGAGGVGGLLIVTKSSTSYYPTFDGNGNVSEYLNSSGAGVVHFEYDAFGNVVNFTESGAGLAATFRHRFSTKPQDTETGLLYYGYRYYDPVTGRWPSRDPIEERGGTNVYAFVTNDGSNQFDLLGLNSCEEGNVKYRGFCVIFKWVSGKETVACGSAPTDELKEQIEDTAKEAAQEEIEEAAKWSGINDFKNHLKNTIDKYNKWEEIGSVLASKGTFSIALTLDYNCCECEEEVWNWGIDHSEKEWLDNNDLGTTYSFAAPETFKSLQADFESVLETIADNVKGICRLDN